MKRNIAGTVLASSLWSGSGLSSIPANCIHGVHRAGEFRLSDTGIQSRLRKKISEGSAMQEDPPSSEEQQWILRFPQRPDLVLAFMTNIGNSGFPGVGIQYEGIKPIGWAMAPKDLAELLPVILAMIERGVHIMEDGEFASLQEALKAKKLPENVISLFERRKK